MEPKLFVPKEQYDAVVDELRHYQGRAPLDRRSDLQKVEYALEKTLQWSGDNAGQMLRIFLSELKQVNRG